MVFTLRCLAFLYPLIFKKDASQTEASGVRSPLQVIVITRLWF